MLLAANQVAAWIAAVVVGVTFFVLNVVGARKGRARRRQQRDDEYARKLQREGVEGVVVGKPLPPHAPPRPPSPITRRLIGEGVAWIIACVALLVVTLFVYATKGNRHYPIWYQWFVFVCLVAMVAMWAVGFICRRARHRKGHEEAKLTSH